MKTFGIVANKSKKNSTDVTREIISFCMDNKIDVLLEDWMAKKLDREDLKSSFEGILKKSDLILALGGDGTILTTANRMKGCSTPLMGINLGGLGFLTGITYHELGSSLGEILKGGIRVQKRIMLNASVRRDGKMIESFDAINDVVITKGALARMLNIKIYIGTEYLTNYTSDGLIISTPTGSTAHSLSAGGPIVCPDMPALLVTPICPHALGNRPLIVSDSNIIKASIESNYEDIFLTIDGQVGAKLKYKDEIDIKKSKNYVNLAVYKGSSYFSILREKLNWSGHLRDIGTRG